MKSVFMHREKEPADADIKEALGKTHRFWVQLVAYTNKQFPGASNAWHYSGDKYGWSFRISDKKRVLVYLLPREKFFKAALVFGQKATDAVLCSSVSDVIKNELKSAKAYAEGRGIRIDVKDQTITRDIETLIAIKIAN